MSYDEYAKRAIAAGKPYNDLPPRIKAALSPQVWKLRVKEHCIQKGMSWVNSLASMAVSEQEYYEELLKCYKDWLRIFPYHLAGYITRVLRVTPFRYYLDLIAAVFKDEKSYDRIPNFTAADILRVMGIGRNEYIQIVNACKAKRIMWRLNKSIVREFLPQQPIPERPQPWWKVAVINIAESEYRELDVDELAVLKTACMPGGARVVDLDGVVLDRLLARGLVYYEVPIAADDRFSIPPLEGFVSNKTSEVGDSTADPLETLLYSVFVANSTRLTVAELATILGVTLPELQAALGLAVRLGFATSLLENGVKPSPSKEARLGLMAEEEPGAWSAAFEDPSSPSLASLKLNEGSNDLIAMEELPCSTGHSVAIVVDAECTSYLMMGALSPGLKRHSVTLFEGGRISGANIIEELVEELKSSQAIGQEAGGEMVALADWAGALRVLVEAVLAGAQGAPVELLRKESLAGLSATSAIRVLSSAYCALLPVSPLAPPHLPLPPPGSGPVYYGHPGEAANSPWLNLLLYAASRCGPQSITLMAGQRLWRLPNDLESATHALLWPFDNDSKSGVEGGMMLVEATFLLYTLNELLTRTAVLVQPITCNLSASAASSPSLDIITVVDVPLPLPMLSNAGIPGISQPSTAARASTPTTPGSNIDLNSVSLLGDVVPSPSIAGMVSNVSISSGIQACGVDRASGKEVMLELPSSVTRALGELGVLDAPGHLCVARFSEEPASSLGDECSSSPPAWTPLSIHLGIPLHNLKLCTRICDAALAAQFLSPSGREARVTSQKLLLQQLQLLIQQYTVCQDQMAMTDSALPNATPMPAFNLLFDGTNLNSVNLSECVQGLLPVCQ